MSSAADVAIRVDAGRDFSVGDLSPPDLSQAPQLTVETWQSARDAHGQNALAWGCVRGDASSWSADATDLAQGKLAEIASGTAARMRGSATPMHVVGSRNDDRDRTLVADDGAASARTFLVFTNEPPRTHGCFVACASDACRQATLVANVTGSLTSPPAPGIALRSVAFVVHHPQSALCVLAAILASCAALAIVTRPSPRKRRRP